MYTEAVPGVPNLSDLETALYASRSLGEGDGVPFGSGLKAGETNPISPASRERD